MLSPFLDLWDPSLVVPFSFRLGFPSDSDGKEYACNAGNPSSVPGSGQFPGERNGNSLSILTWRILWTEQPGKL